MLNKAKRTVFALRDTILAISLTACFWGIVRAEDSANWVDRSVSRLTENRYQLAVGVDFRTDNSDQIDAQPQFAAQLLRFFSSHVALKIDLGYSFHTEFAQNSDAHTLSVGAGVRLQEPARFLSPYVDLGVKQERYGGSLDSRDFSQQKIGLAVGIGFSLRVDPDSRFDFGLQHLMNSRESRPIYGPEWVLPPENDYGPLWPGMGGPDPYDLYNPTHLYIHYRFSL